MNWGTLYQRVRLSSGRPLGQVEDDKIKAALIEAIEEHRHEHFWFNEVAFNFALTSGIAAYGETTLGFPKELLKILGEELFLDIAGKPENRYPVERRPIDYIDGCRAAGPFNAQPEVWAFANKQIEFYPTPNSSSDVIRGRAVVDQWVPITRFDSGGSESFKFYKPGTTSFVVGNELTDAYPTGGDVNPWISNPEVAGMIRRYAEYLLHSQYWQRGDGQDERALMAYTQARAAIESRTHQLRAPYQIEPFPIGGFW